MFTGQQPEADGCLWYREYNMPRTAGGKGRGKAFKITVDGSTVQAYPGETVAAALMAAGRYALGESLRRKRARGVYCGMGVCYECAMVINGRPNVRACQTKAVPGMNVATQRGSGNFDAEA